jgi:hypothetical protein
MLITCPRRQNICFRHCVSYRNIFYEKCWNEKVFFKNFYCLSKVPSICTVESFQGCTCLLEILQQNNMASERRALKKSHETGVLIHHVNTSCHVVTLLIGIHCQQGDRMLESMRPTVQLRRQIRIWRKSSSACIWYVPLSLNNITHSQKIVTHTQRLFIQFCRLTHQEE